jgi:hypothetical protein
MNNKNTLKYINVQGLLKYLLAMSIFDTANSKIHYYYYLATRTLIKLYEETMNNIFKSSHASSDLSIEQHIEESWVKYLNDLNTEIPLLPSLNVFGSNNKSDFTEVICKGIEFEIDGKYDIRNELPDVYSPKSNYKPKNFDYSSSRFFSYDGSICKL